MKNDKKKGAAPGDNIDLMQALKDSLAQYGKGEDVGHGVDHDCDQCRAMRRTLAAGDGGEGAPPSGTASAEPYTPPADETIENIAERNSAAIDELMRNRPELEDATARFLPVADLADETQFVRDTRSEMLDGILDRLLQTEFEKQGLRFDPDEIEVVDELVADIPGLGVMIMKGYVPDDDRWHVELVHGVSRAHVKHRKRDVAIKVAALTLFNGEKGGEVERRYQELEQANAAAKAAEPGAWTGQTQAGA